MTATRSQFSWAVREASGAYLQGPEEIHGSTFRGHVVSVPDGDTINVQTRFGGPVPVRLAGIDSPELAQPFGVEAGNYTRAELLDKDVTILMLGRDKYNRVVGVVFDETEENFNAMKVLKGLAWVYPDYNDNPLNEFLSDLQTRAQNEDAGLWGGTGAKEHFVPALWRLLKRRGVLHPSPD